MREAYRVIDVPRADHLSGFSRARADSDARRIEFIEYLKSLAEQHESTIDGNTISNIFFPEGSYDLFVSHSHADLETAYRLKDISADNGYRAFVDSDTWLDVRDLIKALLERSSAREYKYILHLASNAYIILATALMQMINKSKVFIFLDTNNSLPDFDGQHYQTHSPWLKLELETCHLLLQRVLTEGHVVTGGMASYPQFAYDADIEHLPVETYADLLIKIRDGALPRWRRTR